MEYNQSPEDLLNGPCNMHCTFIDGKRVSNHKMKYCRTFIKMQEAINSKQTEARSQGYTRTPGSVAYNAPPPPPMPNNGGALVQGEGNQSDGYLPSKGHIISMIHPVPKSKKE
jgi:hypothetical protein